MTKNKQNLPIDKSLTKSENNFPVVGVGASAGGLTAFKELLKAIPEKSGMAFVLVQHLHPEHESVLPELLQKVTKIPVLEISDDMVVEPDHIYIIPSNKMLLSNDGKLELSPRPKPEKNMLNLPINLFFTSLAEVHQTHSLGVVLSGTGSDGTLGLKAINAHGGITIAQDLESAQYNGMPKSAAESGIVDFILSPDKIPSKLIEITKVINGNNEENGGALKEEEVYKQILSVLRVRKGTDFTYYKQTTIRRRILRRMAINKKEDPNDFLDFLRKNKAEQDNLYQDLLIPVTHFFRDTKIFEHLTEVVFPKIMENKKRNDSVRIWSVGCSTGQEAYSMVMCIKESLANNPALSSGAEKVQIFASDISELAIAKARKGEYSINELEGVDAQRLSEFFVKSNGNYQVKKEIREMCVFAVHDFLKDPPFGNMDLISCRNVLIYMEPYLQKKALTTFHYALNAQGDDSARRTKRFLLLGKSETCSGVPNLFSVSQKKNKLFVSKNVAAKFSHGASQHPLERQFSNTKGQHHFGDFQLSSKKENRKTDFEKTADELILRKYTPSGVVVNEAMDIVHFRGSTAKYLEQQSGKPSHNLLKMAKNGLGFELRNLIHKAKKEKEAVTKRNIPISVNGNQELISIEAIPLPAMEEPHYLILFQPLTPMTSEVKLGAASTEDGVERNFKSDPNPHKGNPKKDKKDLRIKQLENELGQVREDMRSISEEQEAANEELQSANEELLSGNEELQSLNEEVETSKEELQSTNEELTVVNQELISLNDQLTGAKEYAEAIVETVREPLLVLDEHLRVVSANKNFYRTFQIKEKETERKLIYEIGDNQWDIPELRRLLSNILPEKEHLNNFEVNRDFQSIGNRTMLLNARQLQRNSGEKKLILLAIEDITEQKSADRRKSILAAIVDSSDDAIIGKTLEGKITSWNNGAEKLFGYTPKEAIGENIRFIIPTELQDEENTIIQKIKKGTVIDHFETMRMTKNGTYIPLSLTISPIKNSKGIIIGASKIARDISAQKQLEETLRKSEKRFREMINALPAAVYTTDAKGLITHYNPAAVEFAGRTPELGKDHWCVTWKLYNPDGTRLPHEECPMAVALKEGRPVHGMEAIAERPDGTKHWFMPFPTPLRNAQGEVVGGINMLVDITERKEAAKKVKASESHFRQMADLMPGKVLNTDEDGNAYYFNRHWLKDTGKKYGELEGRGWQKMIHPDDLEEFMDAWKNSLKTGKEFEMEFRCKDKKGKYDWHLGRATAVRNEEGAVKVWINSAIKIQKIKEEEKRKEDFLKMVSHELKTPVTSIKGYTQLLLNLCKPENKGKLDKFPLESSLERIDVQITRLTRLISEMLDLSRFEDQTLEFHKKKFPLNKLVKHTVEDIERTNTNYNIELVGMEEGSVIGDEERLSQVLINFITNAIKYSPDDKNVVVNVYKTQNNQIAVSIRDHGIGIDKKDQKKIFERFYRVDGENQDTYAGFGIGLNLCQEIIKRHNGRITVESEKNKGSVFTFILPCEQESN